MKVEFIVSGEPKGKGRPRFARQGSFVKTYTPQETLSYENLIKWEYQQAAEGIYFDGDLYMTIICGFGIPKSASKKKIEEMILGKINPTKKPDCDNVAKIVCDALNGVAYKDDSQITYLSVIKKYSEKPYVKVSISDKEEYLKAANSDLLEMVVNVEGCAENNGLL